MFKAEKLKVGGIGITRSSDGATMVEFSIAIVVIFSLLFVGIELCRYFLTYAALNKGAIDGLYLARTASYVDVRPGSPTYPKYLLELSEIRNRALKIPRLFVETLPNQNTTSLIEFVNVDSLGPNSTITSGPAKVILIRPGDLPYTASDGAVFSHPSYPLFSSGDNLFRLLEVHPLIVVMRARFRSWIPLLDGIVVEGRAVGYREIVSDGTYLEQAPPVQVPTFTAGGPPSPPLNPPSPTATATPTISPIPQDCSVDCNDYCLQQDPSRCGSCINQVCVCHCIDCEEGVCSHG